MNGRSVVREAWSSLHDSIAEAKATLDRFWSDLGGILQQVIDRETGATWYRTSEDPAWRSDRGQSA